MKRIRSATFACSVTACLSLFAGPSARADIPVGYKGKPFDPAVAGGPICPATVKAGPYAIPGRLDFVNYDLGGDGVAYHTGDHIVKGGTGYRVDTPPTATFSLTTACAPTCPNVWYDSGTALDGTVYPSATTGDFSIGAVQNNDYVNITVNVVTTGTYSLSSTWATGNGPPGGEGGDGTMGLAVFSNGTQLAMWTAVFPNYNTEADFRHWKPYPNFATVTLTAGPQVIKLQSKAKHLQLDYVQFDLVGADGGTSGGVDAGPAVDGGLSGAGGGGVGGSTGAAGAMAAGGTSGGDAGSGATGAAGAGIGSAGVSGSGGASSGASGTSGGSIGGTAGTGTAGAGKSGGCALAPVVAGESRARKSSLAVVAMALGLIWRSRRRRRASTNGAVRPAK